MAEINSVAIANTKIKLRFTETYASEGANIQMGVNAKGAYRGAIVQESAGGADQQVEIDPAGSDTVILHHNTWSGICTVVREAAKVTLDLSSQFPLSGAKTWYVYMTVDYALHADTEGKFAVGDTIPTDAVRLATIEMAGSESVIENANIRTDGVHRDKVLGKRGVILRKMVEIAASPGRTRFQIPDKVSFVNDLSNRTRMSLRGAANQFFTPLRGSDGGQIVAGAWYADEVGGSPLGPGGMDGDYCYQSPWVALDFTNTVDASFSSAFKVVYYAYVPFDELEVGDWNVGEVGAHTNDIWGKSQTGTPDSISTDTLVNQIAAILSLINGRIRRFHPNAATSTWQLLWRSNNVVNDADVDANTLSLYFNNKGLLLAQGGYVGNDGVWKLFVPAGSSIGNVYAISFQDGVLAYRWKNVTAVPAEMRLATTSDWDSYDQRTSSNLNLFEIARGFLFDEYGTVQMNATADGTNDKYLLILSLAAGNIRVYWGGDTDPDACWFRICFGCQWNDGAGADGLWQKSSSTLMNAWMISIGPSSVELAFKDKDDADYSTGWTFWTSTWSLVNSSNGYAAVQKGGMEEKILVPFKFVLSEEYVRAMRNASYVGPLLYEGINLRDQWSAPPSSFSWDKFHSSENTVIPAVDSVAIAANRMWGLKVSGQVSNITSHLQTLALWTAGDCFQKTYTLDFDNETVGTNELRPTEAIGWHDGSGTIVRVIADNGDTGTIEIQVTAGNPPDNNDTLTVTHATPTTIDQLGEIRDSGNIYIKEDLPSFPIPHLRVGQTVGVRGNINGAWAIKEFIYEATTRCVLVVDTEGNTNPMVDGDSGDGTVYYLDHGWSGAEKTAFYLLTVR